MPAKPSNIQGIAAMIASTAFFVVNDTFMKLAMSELPPFQVLFLRGVAATLACSVIVVALGHWRNLSGAWSVPVILRACSETVSVLCYVVALAHMPIADVIAICQTSPLMVVLAVALISREPIGPVRLLLIAAGFLGAVLVAHPGPGGISIYALLAFVTAVTMSFRDVIARGTPPQIPAFVVTVVTVVVVTAGSGAMTLLAEGWVQPRPIHLGTLLLAGVLVMLGHLSIFLAYRLGAAVVVAPFFYTFAVWAVVAGLLVWGEMPGPLALTGIIAIVASGLGLILEDQRRIRTRRLATEPTPIP
jgi:drug/metabolite transporter (DMT)-like permease